MPIPVALGAALIGAGGNIADSILTGSQNKKNRQFQEHMWNKTNEYNKPIMQMARFKEAGLNPHLIYGQGNSGNTSMPANPDTEVPQTRFADIAHNYVGYRKQQVEIDNMEKAREVMEADKLLKIASATNALANSDMTNFQRKQAIALNDTVLLQAGANLNSTITTNENLKIEGVKKNTEIQNILAQTQLTTAQKSAIGQTISESRQRIANMKAENNLTGLKAEEQRLRNDLIRKGMNPNDNALQRVIKETVDAIGLPDAMKWIKQKRKVIFPLKN